MKLLNANTDLGLLVLRLSVGGLMLFHGVAKLVHGLAPIKAMLAAIGLPGFISYGNILGEVVAPLMIIVGYRTRLGAFVFVGNCLVAIAMAHLGDLFSLGAEGGWALELLGLYLFGAAALWFTGGGKYALSSKSKWD